MRTASCAGQTRILETAAAFRAGARPATAEMTRYIDASRAPFGVKPICKTLQVAPSTYYAARCRPASARCLRDEELRPKLRLGRSGRVRDPSRGGYITRTGGVQHLSIRYTERLAEAGIATSVGSRGDSYDNAMAETINGLYKAELVYRGGPWKGCEGLEDLELATLEWVDWFNNHRLFGALDYVPPPECEACSYTAPLPAAAGTQR